ncbi:MAG: RsmD family RNA methyltransferase [Chloroflexi bacterium]|nr:RsmD family RNA methyltransferase [Chloroflexota bacterium]MCL5108487.1 RsmD family RNA methyltransferase [Chloroflexota bacterium]
MRVIAGSAKGRPLHAPRGQAVRPTSDKIKGALFAMLESLLFARRPAEEDDQPAGVWQGLRWLDLYAGSGALAIEALSRGAAGADIVEASRTACQVIKRNLAETGLQAEAHVHCQTVQVALAGESGLLSAEGYDIIALDPPYADPNVLAVLRKLADSRLLRRGGLLAVEHSRRVGLPDNVAGLARLRERVHGDTVISIYAAEEATG